MIKKWVKYLAMGVLIIMALGIFTGCSDYGYEFHFDVDGGNGDITIENEISARRVKLCSDESHWCKLECSDSSHIAMLLGGKNGSRELTFIATPNEGYQVKEWLFNGEIVEGNKTTSYKAIVTSGHNYYGVIAVRFEPIQG